MEGGPPGQRAEVEMSLSVEAADRREDLRTG